MFACSTIRGAHDDGKRHRMNRKRCRRQRIPTLIPQHGFSKQLPPNAGTMTEDVADAVAWPASDESRFVTVEVVSVDVGVARV